MTKVIDVVYDAEAIALHIKEPEVEVLVGDLVKWVFHGVPERFSPMILFKAMIESDGEDKKRYYGPFAAVTQEIPGADGGQTCFWGIVVDPRLQEHTYRAVIQTGVGEDPFDEPYGNSPDSVGKAVVISTEGVLRKSSHTPSEHKPHVYEQKILEIAKGADPFRILSGATKVVPITQQEVDGVKELRIHDDFLLVKRVAHDTVVWDFSLIPEQWGWFPIIDFIGGAGMAYEDIINMHFGPFSALTYTAGRVIGTGHGKVPGQFHYRAAMANISTNKMSFKSSPDPIVDYPDPTNTSGGSGGGSGGSSGSGTGS